MAEFLKRKRAIEPTTRRSYESHVRLYLTPYLGNIRLDQLRVSDIAGMFDAIEEFNDTVATERASGDPARVLAVRTGDRLVPRACIASAPPSATP